MKSPTDPALDVLQHRATQLTTQIAKNNTFIVQTHAAIELFQAKNSFVKVTVLNIDSGAEVVTIPIFGQQEALYDGVLKELYSLYQASAARRTRLETALDNINRQLAAMGNDTSTGRHNGDQ